MNDLALQVSNTVMGACDPPAVLTKFICNIKAWVFAKTQSAPTQKLKKEYGLHAEGRPDV